MAGVGGDTRWRLTGGEAHVWLLDADEAAAPVEPEVLLPVLSAGERERQARFVFARDRDRFLVAHAALRLILAAYAGVDPASIAFRTTPHGRPEIDAPSSMHGLRFNLSHTQGLIAAGVCRECDIGVDVEWHGRRTSDLQALADRFFSPIEARALSLDPEDRATRFFAYWTLKESYIKARGLGLSLPLDGFWFTVDEGAPPRIAIDPSLEDESAGWRFLLAPAGPEHTLAAAVRAGEADVRFVVRTIAIGELLG